MPISREELQQLIERGSPDGHILSVYLDVDQSRAANLNRGFEAALKERLRALQQQVAPGERQEWEADAGRVQEFVSGYEPRGRALVVFCDASTDFFWNRDLYTPLRGEVRWDEKPYVRPLLEALDEYERYSVALVSSEELRLFTVYLGEIEERQEVMAAGRVKHTRSAAKDNRLSPTNLQHREEDQVHRNFKDFALRIERYVGEPQSGRLVLAGPQEVTREVYKMLPKRLQSIACTPIHLPVDASPQEVLRATQRIEEDLEREGERHVVEELITAAAKNAQAVLALPGTLEALHEGRIRKLVYAEGLTLRGTVCLNCDSLLVSNPDTCPYCSGGVRPLEDIVERIVERVVNSGGEAENVRADAAERLRPAGGIGALLRF